MADQLSAYIKQRLATLRMTQTELCRRAGISRQTLHTFSNAPDKMPALQTLVSMAGPLEVHPIRLLQILCDARMPPLPEPRPRTPRDDASAFVSDGKLADGAMVLAGQRFQKSWTLQNVGTVPWRDRYLQCMDEELVVYSRVGEVLRLAQNLVPDQTRVPIPLTRPGDTVEVSVGFTAPGAPGTVMSYWKMTEADGTVCFPEARGVWVKVQVTSLNVAENGAAEG